jgi:hypothetical protein
METPPYDGEPPEVFGKISNNNISKIDVMMF